MIKYKKRENHECIEGSYAADNSFIFYFSNDLKLCNGASNSINLKLTMKDDVVE